MSQQRFFDAARDLKRELSGSGLSKADVDALNAVIEGWPTIPKMSGLGKPSRFYEWLRSGLGQLEQHQVDGINVLLAEMRRARWPRSWTAYGLATAWWETNKTMQPVEEAYHLKGKVKDLDAWRRRNLRYYPWHGRGYPQTTWERNYRIADEELGLEGRLLKNPALMLTAEVAAPTMVKGMEQGWFTGKRLADYLPIDGRAGHDAFKAARRIINGTDKDDTIAKLALIFDAALEAGEWA